MPGKRIRQKSKGEAIPEGKAKPKRKTPKRKSGVSGWAKWRGQKSASKQTAEAATQTETHTAEAAAQTQTRTAEAKKRSKNMQMPRAILEERPAQLSAEQKGTAVASDPASVKAEQHCQSNPSVVDLKLSPSIPAAADFLTRPLVHMSDF